MYRVLFLHFVAFLCIAFHTSPSAMAQNLVPNGSFEEYDECPDWLDQFTNATGWQSWRGTPDFFHACDTTLHVGTPLNLSHGYQVPRSGDGYGGIIGSTNSGNREIMGIELSAAMDIGQDYYIEFYWNRTFGGWAHSLCDCAISHLGALLTTKSFHNVDDPIPIGNFAHVVDMNILADTTNWVKISGWVQADSAYTHIGIGNFFELNSFDVEFYNGTSDELLLLAYYFIDDICVAVDPSHCNLVTSSSQKEPSPIRLFPNPTHSVLNIGLEHEIKHVQIYDITGKLAYSNQTRGRGQIDVSSLASGTYFIKAETNNGSFTGKFLKLP